MSLRRVLRPLINVRLYFTATTMTEEAEVPAKKAKIERQFDFKRYGKRHVFFMVSYLGWDYSGLVAQGTTEMTIENFLHEALVKTKLVESIKTANYRRCGRTDKGVSGFRQVISLDVRTLAKEGEGVFVPEGHTPYESTSNYRQTHSELNYVAMLNRVLPIDIRVLAWAPVPLNQSARYDCRQRTYKYFFPKGDLDIEVMRTAGQLFVGTHDLRNFCKFDLSKNKVKETIRTISSVSIELADADRSGNDPYDMYVLTISAPAFLWHQIRNIVTVLVLIGQGKEKPDVITSLLDIANHPRKPQYTPALEIPLILYDCQFDNVKWHWDKDCHRITLMQLQGQWAELAAKAQMLKAMCEDLAREGPALDPTFQPVTGQAAALITGDKMKQYRSLLKRPTCPSLEEMQAKCDSKVAKKEAEARDSESEMGDG